MRKLFIAIALCLVTQAAMGADCFITMYTSLGTDAYANPMPVPADQVGDDTVTFTTSSVSSGLFVAGTRLISIICDSKTHLRIGPSPTAAVTDRYLAQDTAEYFFASSTDQVAFRTP